MATKNRVLVSIRGNDEYAAFLDELCRRVAQAEIPLPGGKVTRHAVAEYAIRSFAIMNGVAVPSRKSGRGPAKNPPKSPYYKPRRKPADSQATQITEPIAEPPDSDVKQ